MSEVDPSIIRHALKTAREFGYRTVRIKQNGLSFRATLDPDIESDTQESATILGDAVISTPTEVTIDSTFVGYFSPAQGLKPGARVAAGDTVGSITALGLNNEVTATATGEILRFEAEAGAAVEYGQPLILVKTQ
ncbi:MAG: acetyl-CoA carboxylase biotin carboxyl carrier protein subunit [Armatimonadetes bacterium]|nr:acetyl-CoA carboxylase biotin carboxyl carrier protein subunit [Armatimonadota bacterium]